MSLITIDTDNSVVFVYTGRAFELGVSPEGVQQLRRDAEAIAAAFSNVTQVRYRIETMRPEMQPNQMTLGQLREALRAFSPTANVQYDRFGAYWNDLDSWRGSYAEPAIGWQEGPAPNGGSTVAALVEEVDKALSGCVYGGWKGGEFTFHEDSPVWIDNRGVSSQTYLVAVEQVFDSLIVLRTASVQFPESPESPQSPQSKAKP